MPVLNDADQVYLGTTAVDAVYLGTAKVWPPGLDTIPGLSSWVEADDVPQTISGPITVAIPARVGPTPLSTPNSRLLVNSTGGYKAFDFNLDPDQWFDVHNVTLGPDVTVLAVVDAGAQPYEHADLMDFNHALGGGWVIQQDGYGPGTFFAWRKGGAFTLTGDLSYPGVPHIVEVHKEGGHVRMSFGAATTSVDGVAGLDMPLGQLRVGNYVNPSGPVRPFLGKISAWAIWARALTPAELTSARSYFQEKWLVERPVPQTIPGLTMWLDAATLALADGDPVATWPDKSPSGFHAQTVYEANRPTYRASATPNGMPAVEFNVAPFRYLDIPGLGTWLSGRSTYSLIIVHKPMYDFGNYPVLMTGPNTAPWQWLVELDASSGVYWGHVNGHWRLYTANMKLNEWAILEWDLGTPKHFFKNGTEITAMQISGGGDMVDTVPHIGTTVRLGAYYDGGLGAIGPISEILLYDHALLNAERQQVEAYLRTKYGL